MSDKKFVGNDEEGQKRKAEFVRIRLLEIVANMVASVSLADFQQMVPSLQNKPTIAKNLYEIQKKELLCHAEQNINHMYAETNLEEKFVELNDLLVNSTKGEKTEVEEPIDICDAQLSESRKQTLFERRQKLEKMVKEQQALLIQQKTKALLQRGKLESLMKQVKTTTMELKNNNNKQFLS